MQVNCKILSLKGIQKGIMFIAKDTFTFNDLIRWVNVNCPANNKIIIQNNEVSAFYDDRIETYWLVQNKQKVYNMEF